MSAEELILLLDIYIGFDPNRHDRNYGQDLNHFQHYGWICKGGPYGWTVTLKGNQLVKALQQVGDLAK